MGSVVACDFLVFKNKTTRIRNFSPVPFTYNMNIVRLLLAGVQLNDLFCVIFFEQSIQDYGFLITKYYQETMRK